MPPRTGPDAAALPGALTRRAGARVLVVDPDPDARTILTDLLRHDGYRVCGVSTAGDAVRVAREVVPDAIIGELDSPDDERCLPLALTSELGREVPMLVYSAWSFPEDRERALECGARAFLPKPSPFDRIVDLMHGLTAGARGAAQRGD
ncbi:MAG TPA: response regulator [Gemmatimonadaceae bacterium]